MPGGILNLVSYGDQNILIHGNPTKTFFKSTYAKHTNFGIQKFRIDYEGLRYLQNTIPTEITFKVPRYADLLMDIYLAIDLPDIWSPVYKATTSNNGLPYRPYEFKWIKNIGTQIIKEVKFTIGGHMIQKFTGSYLQNIIDRDFDESKKKLFDVMSGNIDELNNPSKFYNHKYPSAYNFGTTDSDEILPSIRGRRIYIPINIWFTLMPKMAFPLVNLQYNQLHIEFTFRPVYELFVVRDVINPNLNNYDYTNYIKPDPTNTNYLLKNFLQQPDASNSSDNLTNIDSWNSDIHIIANYCFLDNDEIKVFTSKPQNYLIKQSKEVINYNIVESNIIELPTNGLVANIMWYLQRSDIYLSNNWSNYTNYSNNFNAKPFFPVRNKNNLIGSSTDISLNLNLNLNQDFSFVDLQGNNLADPNLDYNRQDISNNNYYMYFTNSYNSITNPNNNLYSRNQKLILNKFGILLDGKYRENVFDGNLYNYLDYYTRAAGCGKEGLYFYNFGLQTNPYSDQPSGALNFAKFKRVELEVDIITPPFSNTFKLIEIYNFDQDILTTTKQRKDLYEYTFDLTVQIESYNMLVFTNGTAGLMYTY